VNIPTIMFTALNPSVQCTELSRSSLPTWGGRNKTVNSSLYVCHDPRICGHRNNL